MVLKTLKDFYKLPLKKYVNNNIVTVNAEDSVQKTIEVMHKNNVGFIIVLYDKDRYGILSERDIIKEYAMELYDFYEKPVGEIMTITPVTVEHNDSIGKAFELMDKNSIRHLPVIKKNELVGIISIRDLAHALVEAFPH
ncbi:hypothetical protein BVY03_03085 [bacterium K02(2017)]|nr:hypothetical protein BVY03_03085 [bacterium K02(2017)]